ncbi:MAG: hypothetical protein R6V67_04270 [Spirochaetia bacterium]
MSQWIHFDDDIFYLNQFVRLYLRSLKLDIDGIYFARKVDEDIRFLDYHLSGLYSSLSSTPHNIELQQNLRFLNKTKLLFCELLSFILEGETDAHLDLSEQFEDYRHIRSHQYKEVEEIRDILKEILSSEDQSELISSEEYRFLLNHDA